MELSFWTRQLGQIREGGIPVLKKKLRTFLRIIASRSKSMTHAFWAVPTVLLIRALRPFVLIRFGTIRSKRIGHFAQDAAERWARLQEQPVNMLDWFWLPQKTCNQQWAKMVRRTLPVYPWVRCLVSWNHKLPGGTAHSLPSSLTQSRDIEGLFEKHDVKFPFLQEETDAAKEWLRRQGWQEGEPFVCLLVRDAEYLVKNPMHGRGDEQSYERWSYHSYRNSDIATYVPAMEWLAEQGVWVLRMGKIMAKPIPTQHPRIIDYAFHPQKSDLLDVWLFANCTLCISTGTGPDAISNVYGKPVLYLNYLPLSHLVSYHNSVTVPKKLLWANTNELLSVRQYLENRYLRTEEYSEAGIDIIDLTPEEILVAVQEFWQRLQGTWVETEEHIARQRRFWEILKAWTDFSKYHGWINPEARIGASFLRENPEWLD